MNARVYLDTVLCEPRIDLGMFLLFRYGNGVAHVVVPAIVLHRQKNGFALMQRAAEFPALTLGEVAWIDHNGGGFRGKAGLLGQIDAPHIVFFDTQ